jgi:Tol biopolymer transport system component
MKATGISDIDARWTSSEVVSLGFQPDGTPSWSPDGTKLLYVDLGTIRSRAAPIRALGCQR